MEKPSAVTERRSYASKDKIEQLRNDPSGGSPRSATGAPKAMPRHAMLCYAVRPEKVGQKYDSAIGRKKERRYNDVASV